MPYFSEETLPWFLTVFALAAASHASGRTEPATPHQDDEPAIMRADIDSDSNRAKSTTALLPKLRKVSITRADTESGIRQPILVSLASLPPPRKFTAFAVAEEGPWPRTGGNGISESQLPVMALTELDLIHSSVKGNRLETLLRCCPKLERFSYENGGSTVDYPDLDCSKFFPALQALKRTLQALRIDDDRIGILGIHDNSWKRPVGSFRGIEKLHTIKVPARILIGTDDEGGLDDEEFGRSRRTTTSNDVDKDDSTGVGKTQSLVDALPESLVPLTIHDPNKYFAQHLEELLEQLKEVTPALEVIELGARSDLDKHTRDDLASRFKSQALRDAEHAFNISRSRAI